MAKKFFVITGKGVQPVHLKLKRSWLGIEPSITKKRIMNDPAFERTRENNAHFGRAARGAKLLRMAIACIKICLRPKGFGSAQRSANESDKIGSCRLW